MIFTTDPDLLRHRESFSFYYDRTGFNEVLAMDALYFVSRSLTLAVNTQVTHCPSQLADVLNRLTDVLELQFMDLVRVVYLNPTYGELTDAEREAVTAGCLSIQFEEADVS